MPAGINIAINGFGRIGRRLFRLLLDHTHIEVVAINDVADVPSLAHLLKYDSIHGVLHANVKAGEGGFFVNDIFYPVFHQHHPEAIDWLDHRVDYVVEASGKFKTREELQPHLKNCVKKVILTVPPADKQIPMVVLGVNNQVLMGDERIISNASCTTNNAAPMLKLLDDNFGVDQAYITTVHSYTSDQSLHDKPHRDLRRSRAAAQSIIPTTTGAAKALTRIFPHLGQVIGGCGIRVPVPNGSLTDMTLNLKNTTSIGEVNRLFQKASQDQWQGLVQYTEAPIVSIDILGNPHSCIFDAGMTSVIGHRLVKIIGWYDNETGYSSRLIDLISVLNNY